MSDRITLTIAGGEHVTRAVLQWRALIAAETLTEHLSVLYNLDDLAVGDGVAETTLSDGHRVRIQVAKR